MSTYVDRAGTFRGTIREYGAREHKTGSWSLNVQAVLDEYYNPDSEEWEDWQEYQVTANGYLNIIQKDGNWNASQVSTIMEVAGWNGSFESLEKQTWKPLPCQFDIKLNDYDNSFRIEWLADFDRVPGQLGNLDAKTAKEMDTKLHGSLKALTGNIQRQKQKQPEGTPVAPPSSTESTSPSDPPGKPSDNIPF